jgi:hypothetical protein
MSRHIHIQWTILVLTGSLFLTVDMFSQTPSTGTAVDTPVGHWVAEHPSDGGIGSWWDFRPDGTVTLYFGAMVTIPVTRSGDILTMPSGTAGTPPSQIKFLVEGDILSLRGDGKELTYTRVGIAPSATDSLLGKWRRVPSKVSSADPKIAALEKAEANGLYRFSSDGTESVRIPFGSREGTWNAHARTFRFQNETVVYSFLLSGMKLVLGQPPDGTKTDTYLPDALFEH